MLKDIFLMVPLHGDHEDHHHEHTENILVDAWNIFTDPGHFIAEIWFTLVIDFVVIFLGYQLLVKRVVIPRLRKQIHQELDAELKINHENGDEHSANEGNPQNS